MDDAARQLAIFLSMLDDTEQWTTRYLAEPKLTPGERAAAYSLRGYLSDCQLYAVGSKTSGAEVTRRRRKVEGLRWALYLAWVASGRRPG